MRALSLLLIAGLALAAGSPLLHAAVPVRLTGHTGADDVLQKDIVQTVANYGAAFGCPAPTEVRTSMLNASMVPDSLRKPSLGTAYEEWDADFCGKTHRFFVSYWPDPEGGSFLSVSYPYPVGAPGAIFH